MAILKIRTYPDAVLRQKAKPIKNPDPQIERLIDDMIETMYDAPGVGLAANQVGIPVRLVVIDLQKKEDGPGLMVLINPEIVSREGEIRWEEGCLSVPEFYATINRFRQVKVRALDRRGEPFELEASGLLAVVLQHEIDHLDGKLFIDHMGIIAKDIFKRRWKKKVREAVA